MGKWKHADDADNHVAMKRKKNIAFIVFILLLPFCSVAQNLPSFYPFKGFHVGITGQAQYIQKCIFIALTGTNPAPRQRWSTGWEIGMEFSYHFAKYFGITIGINYGTVLSYNYDVYLSAIPDFRGGWKEVNRYDAPMPGAKMSDNEILFPIKLEFHYPLRKDLFFTAEAGVKIKGIFNRLFYEKDEIGRYSSGMSFTKWSPDIPGEYEGINYYRDWGVRNMGKIHCDLLLGVGLYYKLPYGDLLRFTVGINMSFHNIIEGYYKYYATEFDPTESYGTFSVRNDFIYTQLSYIHTLNWQKAKKYLKKQEYSFSSKKEQREKILDLLNDW